jgi:hypothetical protein
VRTVGRDHVVCTWDAATLERRGRFHLPEGFEALVDSRGDPRWILCVPEGRPGADEPEGTSLKAVDAASGEVAFDVRLPPGFEAPSARLLPGDRVLAVAEDGSRICRLDLAGGEAVVIDLTGDDAFHGPGELSADGRWSFLGGTTKGTVPSWIVRLDVATAEVTRIEREDETHPRASLFGFVPGDRYAFAAGPEMRLYERDTMRELLTRPLGSSNPAGVVFSADGARYAVLHVREHLDEGAAGLVPGNAPMLLSVHDTASGSTLLAAPIRSYARVLALDATGSRVVVVEESGRLLLWSVALPGSPASR